MGDPPLPAPGYYADPAGRADHRYWDGGRWTGHVMRSGVAGATSCEQLR